MTRSIHFKRLTFGSLFAIIFTGVGAWLIPLSFISGMAGLFGFDFIESNGVYLHGWKGLISGLIGGPVAAFFMSLITCCFVFPGL